MIYIRFYQFQDMLLDYFYPTWYDKSNSKVLKFTIISENGKSCLQACGKEWKWTSQNSCKELFWASDQGYQRSAFFIQYFKRKEGHYDCQRSVRVRLNKRTLQSYGSCLWQMELKGSINYCFPLQSIRKARAWNSWRNLEICQRKI